MSAIVPFDFHGDRLSVVSDERGVWTSLRSVADALGLDANGQGQRLRRAAWATTCVMHAVAEDGKKRSILCVHLDSLAMWLATVETSRVKPSVRSKLERYQIECARVLRDAFMPAASPTEVRLLKGEVVQLRAQVDALVSASGGVIGAKLARTFILDPVQESARHLCIAAGDASKTRYRSALKDLDGQIRMHVQFPASAGQSWAMLPLARLGDAQAKVAELKARAEKQSRALRLLSQTELFERVVGSSFALQAAE